MPILWTDAAVRDFTQICDYVEEHGSTATSLRAAVSIYKQIGALAKFPETGRTGRKPETRELVLTRLPYVAEILRILHGAQQWP